MIMVYTLGYSSDKVKYMGKEGSELYYKGRPMRKSHNSKATVIDICP